MSPDRDDNRLAYVDSLRAIAALLVLGTHVSEKFKSLSPITMQSAWVHEWSQAINAGRLGVVMFFAISGFVVPFSIKLAHRYPVREFLLKRFFRIYPAYWLSIPLGVVTTYWIWGIPFSAKAIAINFSMIEYLFDVPPAIGLYWTLAVEFVFYLCCAVLVLTRSIANYTWIGLLVVALISIHLVEVVLRVYGIAKFDFNKSLWFMNLGIMFWGALYRAHTLGADLGRVARFCLWGTLLFVVVLYPLAFTYLLGLPYTHTSGYSLGVLAFFIGVRFVRVRFWPLPWLGAISYSIYLFHPVVFNPVLRGLLALPADSWWRSWHLGAYVALIAVLTVLIAAPIYRFVEKPCISLGRKLARRWLDNDRTAAPIAIEKSTMPA